MIRLNFPPVFGSVHLSVYFSLFHPSSILLPSLLHNSSSSKRMSMMLHFQSVTFCIIMKNKRERGMFGPQETSESCQVFSTIASYSFSCIASYSFSCNFLQYFIRLYHAVVFRSNLGEASRRWRRCIFFFPGKQDESKKNDYAWNRDEQGCQTSHKSS